MPLILPKNSTSILLNVFIKDSSVTTGIGKTGLGTANLTVYYYKTGEIDPQIINMVPSATGTYVSGGWCEVDAATIPGFYELGVPDAFFADNTATAADNTGYIVFQDSGFPPGNNAMTTLLEIQLVDHSLDDNLSIQDLPIDVNVTHWNDGEVDAPTVTGIPNVNVTHWDGGVVEEPTVAGMPSVNAAYVGGEAAAIAAQLDANVVQWQGYEVQASHDGWPEVHAVNEVLANVIAWDGNDVIAPVVDGVPSVNVTHWDGGVVEEPTVAGMPSVNAAYAGGEAVSLAPQVDANVVQWQGNEVQASHDGWPEVYAVNEVLANVIAWNGDTVTAPEVDGVPNVNLTHISSDATAASNAEAFFDGTGYAGTGNVIPTVTNVTNTVDANVVEVNGLDVVVDVPDVNVTEWNGTAISSHDFIGVEANVINWNYDDEPVYNFESASSTVVRGAAATGTLSNTQMTTNLTVAQNDYYNGRVVIWTSGSLEDVARVISDYDGASKMMTYAALPGALVPAAGDGFVIV